MADRVTELLQRLAETQGDTHAQSALAAEFALSALPEEERESLRSVLDAAAVLRWFDHSLLASVLGISKEEAKHAFEKLKTLPFVERYRTREEDLRNVHESTRLGWRKQLAQKMPERFRALSAAAAAWFAEDLTPAGRIDWIYHLLCSDSDRGASELESIDRDWGGRARMEDRFALATALNELEETGLVKDRARVWALLVTVWTRKSRSKQTQLAESALAVLELARNIGDLRAEGDAQCLLGDVLLAQGKIAPAQAAFSKYLAISGDLASRDPDNAGGLRELCVAHNRVGDVLEAQGKLAEAQAEYEEGLAISRQLAAQDPRNAGWQKDLATSHNLLGGALESQGKLAAAQTAHEESLAVSRRLTVRDPANASWQRELLAAHSRVGGVLELQGKLAEAQVAYEKALAIGQRIVKEDPANATWQRDLASVNNLLGLVLLALGKVDEARTILGEFLSSSRRLAEQDPSNAYSQRDLAVACENLATLEFHAGRHEAALPLYEEASGIYASLTEDAPGFARWTEEKEWIRSQLALCRDVASKSGSPTCLEK
jgi:tetratricopeptide (TPR) repeat protein